jgi:H/ACA ribonucleoprotein complex subunit 4
VLPVALNDATKALQALLLMGKEYVCVMKLHQPVVEEKLSKVLQEFVGVVYQRPPVRSAVRRRLRKRAIYGIEVVELSNKLALLRVDCQSGTYVRKLCHDIGEALGVGAHLRELRRTRVGPFVEEESLSLYDVAYAYHTFVEKNDETLLRRVVQPVEKCFFLLPKVYVKDSAVDALCHGASLAVPGILRLEAHIKRGDTIGVFTLKGEIVAFMRSLMSSEEMLDLEKGIAATPVRVIMDRGTYPRRW